MHLSADKESETSLELSNWHS